MQWVMWVCSVVGVQRFLAADVVLFLLEVQCPFARVVLCSTFLLRL